MKTNINTKTGAASPNKRKILRVAAVLLSIVTVCLCVLGCGENKGDYIKGNTDKDCVFRYGDYAISRSFYAYWLGRYKAALMYYYSDIEDTDTFWDTDLGSGSYNETLTAYSDGEVKGYLLSDALFDEYGLTLPDATVKEVEERLSELLADRYNGKESEFNAEAAEYGLNFRMLRQIYLLEAKTDALKSYLTSEKLSVTDDARRAYLQENYAHTRHIFIATKYRYNYDESGEVIYDSEGNYTVDLTEEEQKEKLGLVSQIEELSLTAETFDKAMEAYNEDPSSKNYPGGMYVSYDVDYDALYVAAALAMEVGEVRKVECSYGVYFILKEEMPDTAYREKANADFFADYDSCVASSLYDAFMTPYLQKVEVGEEAKKDLTVKTVAPCWYF